jgi:hypothetical protein
VPFEFVELLLPPPQEKRNKIRTMENAQRNGRASRFLLRTSGRQTIANIDTAHHEGGLLRLGPSMATVRAVVPTVTVNGMLEVALTLILAGTEQVASVGTPEQVREAVPLKPLIPRIVRL